jgi:pyruvate,water dikinase
MKFIKLFEEISIKDIALVGGKNASLGEMIQNLSSEGIIIPSGFAITADAYKYFLHKNNFEEKIKNLLLKIDKSNLENFAQIGHEIRSLIRSGNIPDDLISEICAAYRNIEKRYGILCDVAVRSSATAEDLPEASFAGQQETYLNIKGEDELLRVCPDAYASLFTNRAISYRIDNNFDHMSVYLSLGIQKMVRSDKASAGVVFTLDTESGFKDVIFITSSYGLGENIVKGTVNPDEFYVHKPTLQRGYKSLLKKRKGSKLVKMIYGDGVRVSTKNIDTLKEERKKYSISDSEVLELAHYSIIIEDYYTKQKGSWCPMDIEWAKDGLDGKIYIVQARPETVHSTRLHKNIFEEYLISKDNKIKDKIIIKGKSVGRKISFGLARVIDSAKQIHLVQKGEILVTDMTDPDWEPIMRLASGIITNRGGRTCHAAIVSRELGIPAIVGTCYATLKIKTGQEITLDCSNGEEGIVYDGKIPFEIKKLEISSLKRPKASLMMNVGNPDEAFSLSLLPADGVGLARMEFIINTAIQIHPMALVHFEKVTDASERKLIEDLTYEYEDKRQFFIDKLAQEAGTIAAAFYPRGVIIRFSDFKSNEYRQLIGGSYFEPPEENPMIGFRGASRYCHERYQEAFALECKAMKKIIEEMGLNNIKLMIPFVRTVNEAENIFSLLKNYGLVQDKNKLEILMMCEVPSNVILIDQFSKIFDGFSIGSNDLTQLTLAVDRDSALVAPVFDERNEAVRRMLKMAIEGAHKCGKKIGICGQAPSDYPEFAQFLIDLKIDSLSLSPDSLLKEYLLLIK